MYVCIYQSGRDCRAVDVMMWWWAAPPANQTQVQVPFWNVGFNHGFKRAVNVVFCIWPPDEDTELFQMVLHMTNEHINPFLCSKVTWLPFVENADSSSSSGSFLFSVMWPIMKHLTCLAAVCSQSTWTSHHYLVLQQPVNFTNGSMKTFRLWVPFPLDPLVVLLRRFSTSTGISKQTHCNRNTDVHTETETSGFSCVLYFIKVIVLIGFMEELFSLPWTAPYHRAEGGVTLSLASWAWLAAASLVIRMWSPAQLWLYLGVCAGSGLKHSPLLRLNQ